MSIESILKQLEDKGWSINKGNPLYTAPLNDEQRRILGRELKGKLERGNFHDDRDAAALCLYVAQEIAAEYQGGSWSWEVVETGMEFPFTNFIKRNYELIASGMKYAKRPIQRARDSKNRWLSTLIWEGGLPQHLLNEQGGRLQSFFSTLLKAYENYGDIGLKRAGKEALEQLPISYQKSDLLLIASEIVQTVSNLRRELESSNQEFRKDPIRALDGIRSNWRSELPIYGVATAQNLIRQLLASERGEQLGVRIVTSLDFESGTVRRTLHLPAQMTEEQFLGHFDLPRAGRYVVTLVADNEAIFRAGFLTKTGSKLKSSESRIQIPCGAIPLDSSVQLRFSSSAKCFDVPGGDGLSDGPWIFADNDNGPLLAQCSIKSTRQKLRVAIPNGSSVIQATELNEIGQVEDRKLVEVQALRLQVDDDVYEILANQQQDFVPRAVLRGSTKTLEAGGSLVYLGLPEVLDPDKLGLLKEWRPAQGGSWRPWSPEACGDIYLRARRGGETLLRRRIIVLPEGFRLEARTTGSGTGVLEIRGLSDYRAYA